MARLLELPIERVTDANGVVYPGALLDSFLTGTTTPTPTYTTSALNVAHPNPIVANAGGLLPPIFLDEAVTYRFRARTSAGVNITGMDFDPVPGGYDGALNASVPNPVALRTILLDAQVSRMLSGTGDGDTSAPARLAETAKFQAMIDEGRSFSVPAPVVAYAVNTLYPANGQTIEGAGQFREDGLYDFIGNGVDPVFVLGINAPDPGAGTIRKHTLRDLSVTNTGATALDTGANCIVMRTAPNCIIERVQAKSTHASTVLGTVSYRCAIRDSFINHTGALSAIDLLNNMNGLTIENVTCSGGVAGRAIRVGQSQGVRIVSNIIETSLHGVWVASTADSGDGNCNGVVIEANYFEQCKTPLVLGKQFTIYGLACQANMISNSSTSTLAAREASIQFGRIKGGRICDNSIYNDTTEDIFWIWLENAIHGFENLSVVRNAYGITETPANVYVLKGAFLANASVKAGVGGTCNFDFMGSGNPIGTEHIQEWISPTIDASVTSPTLAWLEDTRMTLGGTIKTIDIIDSSGAAATYNGVKLEIGRVGLLTENVNLADMGTLTFSAQGIAPVTLGAITSLFDANGDRTYKVTTFAGATAKFRIRIRYRAN